MFRPSRLLFPTNFSYYSFYAMKYAAALARHYGARLHIAHVVDTTPYLPWGHPGYWLWPDSLPQFEAGMCERAASRLHHVLHTMAVEGIEADYRIVRGAPAPEIVRLAQELSCDLVVVGTHGRLGLEHALFGSVAEVVARNAPAPVLTIKHPEHEFVEFKDGRLRLERVMFPTDFSVYSLSALPYAVSLCRAFDATLVLFHAADRPVYVTEFLPDSAAATVPEDTDREGREWLLDIANRCRGVSVETVQKTGAAPHEIVQALEDDDIDLLVLPTHGRSGVMRLFLGGVAEKVLRRARCPVLTVRPEMAPVMESAAEQSTVSQPVEACVVHAANG